MKVLVITNNLRQASYRVRVEAVLPLLRGRGVEAAVRVRPRGWLARRSLMREAMGYDAVLLQRKLLDPSDMAVLRKHARRIVYDIDDAVMLHQKPVGAIERWRTRRRFEATAGGVDHVVAGNEYLARFFRERGKPVTVLPTVVDPAHYIVKEHRETASPRLVWIGSRSTIPYLKEWVPVFEEAAKRVPGLGLVTIADASVASSAMAVEHVGWSVEGEAAALVRGDIGIAPTPRDEWTLGKCGFKIVQYMAAGLPVIASPVGANEELVRGGVGVLADTASEWVEGIVRLATDLGARREMGRLGREKVERELSLARAAEVWAGVLRGSD